MGRFTRVASVVAAIAVFLAAARPGTALPRVVERHDLAFSQRDPALVLDVYRPVTRGPHPVLVALHGGSWHGGDKSNWEVLGARFAQEGFVVFVPNYRLVPEGVFPRQLRDVETAVTWVRKHAGRFGGDPSRLALIGSSAGAHLALLASLSGRLEAAPAAVVAWSPPTELLSLVPTLPHALPAMVGCAPEACPQRYRAASPVSWIDPADPPVLMAGSGDELIPEEQFTLLGERLDAAGVVNDSLILPGRRHALQYAAEAFAPTVAFLENLLTQVR